MSVDAVESISPKKSAPVEPGFSNFRDNFWLSRSVHSLRDGSHATDEQTDDRLQFVLGSPRWRTS